jgi:hypothetical protein
VPHPLTPIMQRLIGTLQSALPETDVRQIRELIDANQLGLALEWIADTVKPTNLANDPSLRQLLVQLGTQLQIAASIRERLGG